MGFCRDKVLPDPRARLATQAVLPASRSAVRPGARDRMGRVWGFDDEGELHGMWRPTGQKGLWFHAGGLAQCRIFSKVLALQIMAREVGITT